jgi:A/G-specific adenine glycosylase
LAWHAASGRATLPWRTQPSAYRVVVSEFMLQQTQVERVVPLFERFVARFPSFEALAAAPQAEAVRAWKGLGYNSRALRLHRLAREVVERFGGVLPRDEAELRSLPGVGPYTARAIRAFVFGDDVIAPDVNVRRVVERTQFGLEWPVRRKVREIDAAGAELVPAGRAFDFNSALMDLGSSLCTARAPKCLLCPLQRNCAAAPVDAAQLAALAALHAPARGPQASRPFEETTRYVRGRVIDRLRELGPGERISLLDLRGSLAGAMPDRDQASFEAIVRVLTGEGLVEEGECGLRLAE